MYLGDVIKILKVHINSNQSLASTNKITLALIVIGNKVSLLSAQKKFIYI